jgi:hypothetical protein
MKHLKHAYETLAKTPEKHVKLLQTYVYNHCNICNISIYFYNIHLKHLQHTSETSETLEMYDLQHVFSPFFFRMTHRRAGEGGAVGDGSSGTLKWGVA